MSLLMEALRRAEEAKRKDKKEADADSRKDDASSMHLENDDSPSEESSGEIGQDSDKPSSLEPEAKNLQVQFDAAVAQNTSHESQDLATADAEDGSPDQIQWQDLDLHPMPVEPEGSEEEINPQQSEQAELSVADIENSPVGDKAADEFSEQEASPSESIEELPTEDNVPPARLLIDDASPYEEGDLDPLETAAWQSRARKLVNPKRYNKYLLLVLLLPVAGLLYWLFAPDSAPAVVAAPQDRGFFGQTPEEALAEELALQGGGDQLAVVIDDDDQADTVLGGQQVSADTGDSFVIGGEPIAVQEDLNQVPQDLVISQIEQVKIFQITLMSSSSDVQIADSLVAAQSADRADARSQYDNILAQQPNNTDALLALARLDISEGNRESAQVIYRRLQQLNPRDPLAQAGLLEVSQSADSLSREAELKSLIDQHPNIAPLSFTLGNLFASQQRWNEAEGAYTDALRAAKILNSENVHPDYAFNLAITLEQLNEQSGAIAYYREALSLSEKIEPSFDLNLLNDRIEYLGQQL